jgi:di/tripeptidase
VQIDTQSDPYSKTSPSTEKQKELGRVLVDELKQLGLKQVELDQYGFVYTFIPSNVSNVETRYLPSQLNILTSDVQRLASNFLLPLNRRWWLR